MVVSLRLNLTNQVNQVNEKRGTFLYGIYSPCFEQEIYLYPPTHKKSKLNASFYKQIPQL